MMEVRAVGVCRRVRSEEQLRGLKKAMMGEASNRRRASSATMTVPRQGRKKPTSTRGKGKGRGERKRKRKGLSSP